MTSDFSDKISFGTWIFIAFLALSCAYLDSAAFITSAYHPSALAWPSVQHCIFLTFCSGVHLHNLFALVFESINLLFGECTFAGALDWHFPYTDWHTRHELLATLRLIRDFTDFIFAHGLILAFCRGVPSGNCTPTNFWAFCGGAASNNISFGEQPTDWRRYTLQASTLRHGYFQTFCRGVLVTLILAIVGGLHNHWETLYSDWSLTFLASCGACYSELLNFWLHGSLLTFCRGDILTKITPFWFWVFCGGTPCIWTFCKHRQTWTFSAGYIQLIHSIINTPFFKFCAFCGGVPTILLSFAIEYQQQTLSLELQQRWCLSSIFPDIHWRVVKLTQRWLHGILLAFCRGAYMCITPIFWIFCGGITQLHFICVDLQIFDWFSALLAYLILVTTNDLRDWGQSSSLSWRLQTFALGLISRRALKLYILGILSSLHWILHQFNNCLALFLAHLRRALASDSFPGPKSGHTWRLTKNRLILIGLYLTLMMQDFTGYGGEGSNSVMGVAEASPLMLWPYMLSDVKPHDTGPPASSDNQGTYLTAVKKRSLKRAHRRACQQGLAWYKGRLYRPEDFFFMPSVPDPVQPPSRPCNTPKNAHDECHKIHGSKSKIACLQWNVGGLSRHKLDELKTWLSQQHVQVVTLLETRWQYTGEWTDADWIHVHSGSPHQRGMGILTMISRRFCNERDLKWHEIEVGRLLHLRVPTKNRSLDLLCGYQHVDKRTTRCMQQREQWWSQLDSTIQGLPHRNQLLIMADFNTNVPFCKSHSGSEWYRWNGTLTKGSQHRDAGRLISLLRFHNLVVLNSWNSHDGPTYVNGHQSSRIDFALARKSQTDGVAKQPRYLWNAPFMGLQPHGHVPIIHQIALFWNHFSAAQSGGISRQQCHRAHLECSADSDIWHAYVQRSSGVMAHTLHQVLNSDISPEECMDLFHGQVNACFHEFFHTSHAPVRNSPWQQTQDLVLTKWQHRDKFLHFRTCTGASVFRAWYHLARYSSLKRLHRRYAAQLRRLHFCDIVHSAQEAAAKHDMHKMFSLINRYAPKTTKRRIQIRNKDGAIAQPHEELELLKTFVHDIWGGPSQIPVQFTQAPGVPFSIEDLERALSSIPLRKAVAPPFAPGLAWRCQSHVLAPRLYQLLCFWWQQNPPVIPQCWKDGWMTLLSKPQKPTTSFFNLRPIALQDPVGKAIVGLLCQC